MPATQGVAKPGTRFEIVLGEAIPASGAEGANLHPVAHETLSVVGHAPRPQSK